MNILKALFIGIIQGLTEFLPVSSSGHIFLLKNIFNLDMNATFDVFLHFGTLLAVIIFYRTEIYELIKGAFKEQIDSKLFNSTISRKEIFKIYALFIIAMIPAGIAGFLLEDKLDLEPSNTPKNFFIFLAVCFLITAILLFITKFIKHENRKRINKMSFFDSIIIGLFQSIAVLNGVSRSGTTITAALYLKIDREDASRFSFLLSIPLIGAATVLKLFKLIKSIKNSEIITGGSEFYAVMIVGVVASFITGLIALKFLTTVIKKGNLWKFSLYMILPITTSILFYFLK